MRVLCHRAGGSLTVRQETRTTPPRGEGVMDEGTSSSKAIPLRRSRATTRAVTVRERWSGGLATGVRYALTSPRQLWLATLGGTTIALRGARAAWSAMVTEGETVEGWLRESIGRPPRQIASS